MPVPGPTPILLFALLLSASLGGQSGEASEREAAARAMSSGRFAEAASILERLVAARPADASSRRMLADAYAASGRRLEAVAELRKITKLSPRAPAAWYTLGQAYNAIKQDALATFDDPSEDASWRRLLAADALLSKGQGVEAFVLYRTTLEHLPAMVTIHDSIARIYEKTGHGDWAARERAAGSLPPAGCAKRKALCEFRAGRHAAALAAALAESGPESRYWRARAANELALAAFRRLDDLPDSAERRSVRAAQARGEERYTDAAAELKAALAFAPGDPSLIFDLASAYYSARDYEQAIAALSPLLQVHPDDPRLLKLRAYCLLQLRRVDEALPSLQRVLERDPNDPGARVALGRAYLQKGDFAAAVPLIEAHLESDDDGSLHLQLARAYIGLGQRERSAALLAKSEELRRAADERSAAAARAITPPK